MFKRLQWQLTLFYTILLVLLLIIANILVYNLLKSSNTKRINDEMSQMLETIQDANWVQDEIDQEEEHDDGDEESDDDHDDLESTISGENSVYQELVIPSNLRNFSYYTVSDNVQGLMYYKYPGDTVGNLLKSQESKLIQFMEPKLITLTDEEAGYYLMAKMPLVIEDKLKGTVTVAENVTLVYDTMNQLKFVMIVVIILGSFVAFIIGHWLSGQSLKPIQAAYLTKEKFIGDASHELRTPLSVILLSMDVLRMEKMQLSPLAQETIEDVVDEADKMSSLVDKLLFIARNDAGTLVVDEESVDMYELLTNNCRHYEKIARKKGVAISLKIDGPLMLTGDKKLLDSVASTLIDNAIKYNRENGRVFVSGKQQHSRGKAYIEVVIEDTGMGIPENDHQQIFERFHRQDHARSKATEGYGLGLSIAKDIIEAHGGHIQVVSEVNQYTRFTFVLPVKDR